MKLAKYEAYSKEIKALQAKKYKIDENNLVNTTKKK